MIDTVVATVTPSSTFDRAPASVHDRDADDLDRLAASLHALACYSYGEPFVVEASKHLGLEPTGLPDQLRFPVPCSTLIPPRRENDVRHHPALPYGEVPAFMDALRERDAVAARADSDGRQAGGHARCHLEGSQPRHQDLDHPQGAHAGRP